MLHAFVPERGFDCEDSEDYYKQQTPTEYLGCVRTELGDSWGFPNFSSPERWCGIVLIYSWEHGLREGE